MKLDIAEAKARVLLPELARILQVPGKIPERDGDIAPCFWPDRHKHGDRRPSFNFHSRLTRFHCFGCGASGDAGDLIAEWCGISQEEGIRRFLQIAGGESTPEYPLPPRAPVAAKAAPPSEPWNDSPDKRAKRATWPTLQRGTMEALKMVAMLRGLNLKTVRMASGAGFLRFCNKANRPAWVLVSSCGRMAQARRLDGEQWEGTAGNPFKTWSLSGSCAAVPLGLSLLTAGTPFVGIASGGPDFLALLEMMILEARVDDFAPLAILGESIKLAAPVVEQCRGRHVRLFPHNDDAGRRCAAVWAAQLKEAGAAVDAFDFSAFGCKDFNDFVKFPPEARDCEVIPS